MKKAASTDQAQLKELKSRLKCVEQERDKITGKQSDAAGLRRALTAAEAKGKGELQAKDKQLTENLKALAEERKKVSTLQDKVRDVTAKAEKDARESESREKESRRKLLALEGRVEDTGTRYAILEKLHESKTSQCDAEISGLRSLVGVVTEEYAKLASSSVSKVEYEGAKSQATELSMTVLRLQRKLGNANDMVESLAFLSRQLQTNNEWLEEELRDTTNTVQWLSSISLAESNDTTPFPEPSTPYDTNELAFYKSLEEVHSVALREIIEISNIQAENMLSCIRVAGHDLVAAEDLVSQTKDEVTKVQQENARLSGILEASKKEGASQAQLISQKSNEVSVLDRTVKDKEKEILDCEKRSRMELSKRDELLKREREVTSRLQTTVQKCKMAEDALRAEINQLSLLLKIPGPSR